MINLVVFGASGDLAKRKIMPALSRINYKSMKIYAYARSDMIKTYSMEMRKFYDYSTDEHSKNFPEYVTYIKGEYTDLTPIRDILNKDTVAYLSLPPKVYPTILSNLSKFNIKAIAIEKPYGNSLKEFDELLKYKNDNTHFIDHYLLKPLVIAIQEIHIKNNHIFKFLSKDHIKSVECLFLESLLAQGRAYFDNTGIIKDVMQNHLVESLSSLLCDHSENHIINSRTNFIKKLKICDKKYIIGQYKSYKEEMKKDTNTETFAAFKLFIDDEKWKDVPILMAGGKGLKYKTTEITFNIRKESFEKAKEMILDDFNREMFEKMIKDCKSLSLVFNIAPKNEVYLRFSTSIESGEIILITSDEINEAVNYKMDGKRDYELLVNQISKEEYFPSASFEEADQLWKVFDHILNTKKEIKQYELGVEMPEESIEFFNENR